MPTSASNAAYLSQRHYFDPGADCRCKREIVLGKGRAKLSSIGLADLSQRRELSVAFSLQLCSWIVVVQSTACCCHALRRHGKTHRGGETRRECDAEHLLEMQDAIL